MRDVDGQAYNDISSRYVFDDFAVSHPPSWGFSSARLPTNAHSQTCGAVARLLAGNCGKCPPVFCFLPQHLFLYLRQTSWTHDTYHNSTGRASFDVQTGHALYCTAQLNIWPQGKNGLHHYVSHHVSVQLASSGLFTSLLVLGLKGDVLMCMSHNAPAQPLQRVSWFCGKENQYVGSKERVRSHPRRLSLGKCCSKRTIGVCVIYPHTQAHALKHGVQVCFHIDSIDLSSSISRIAQITSL